MPWNAKSLSHLLREAIAQHAEAGRIALVGAFGELSYARLGELVDGFAAAARSWDVGRGDLVGISTARSPESIALFLGLMQAGACPCVMEARLSGGNVLLRMRAVGMKRLVVDRANARLGVEVAAAGMTVGVAEMRRASRAGVGAEPVPGRGDLAMMQFTSGSTGLPKGVLLTHENLLCNAEGVSARTAITASDRLLHLMPLHHTNGINNQLVVPFIAGATVVLADKFRAEEIESLIARHRITYVTGVPTMYARIIPHLSVPRRLASLRFLRCGSAPITVELHRQIEAAFGVPLVVSYGLSEATCTSTMNPPAARRIGTVGTVLARQTVKLLQPGAREEVPVGAEGEICISGPSLMAKYVGPGAEQPIRGGWLRSGDLGRFDADGYLAITGRIKDVIIRGGENISPQQVEDILVRHPAVKACCVVGGPHADLGEVPVAFVVLRPGEKASGAELQALVGEGLSRIYVPAEVRFLGALPENTVGKVDRKALRKQLG
ncbi:MAG: class I adenylate-forming enzyme family protein [Gemmatimonadales bacterium]